MELYSQTAQDESGNITNGATVTVYVAISGAVATIYDKDGNAQSNPFQSGLNRSKGEIEFAAEIGLYNIKIVNGATTRWKYNQSLIDGATESIQVVSTVAVLRTIAPNTSRNIRTSSAVSDNIGGGDWYAVTGAAPGTYVHNIGTIVVMSGGDGSSAWLRRYSCPLDVLWFGAYLDDTNEAATQAACQAALNAGTEIHFPVGKYKVTSLVPQNNTTITAVRNADYLTDDDLNSYITSTNSKIFDVTGTVKGVIFRHLTIIGDIAASSGITGGGQSIQIEGCQIKSCLTGIGDPSTYGGIYSISDSHIHSNARGIRNLIDSHIINNYIYNNTSDGVFLSTGANDVSIIGNKIEWNGGSNISIFEAGNTVIVGNILDRSTDSGISLSGAAGFTITGNKVRRSNAADTPGKWAHFYMLNCSDGIIANNSTRTGDKDDSPLSGTVVPRYVVIDAGGNTNCLVANNGGDGVTGFIQRTTSSGEGAKVFNNPSYRNRLMSEIDSQTITASGGTKDFDFLIPIMADNTQYNRKLYFMVRDGSGAIFTAKQEIIIQRFTGAATVVVGTLTDSAGAVSYAGAMVHAYVADYTTGKVTLTITNNRITDAFVSIEWQ